MSRNSSDNKILKLLIVAAFFASVAKKARASQDYSYGYGAGAGGKAGAAVADPGHEFAAAYNPALLAAGERPRLSMGVFAGRASYDPMPGVITDSPTFRTRDGRREVVGEMQLEGTPMAQWAFGLSFPFSVDRSRKAGIGVAMTGPFTRLRQFVSPTPYDFQSLRYGPATGQFRAALASGLELVPSILYFGVGLSLFVTAGGSADAVLVAENPTGRLEMEVGLNSSIVAGLYAKAGDHAGGLVFRQGSNPLFRMKVVGRVEIARGLDTLELPIALSTSLYYEPHSFEAEWRWNLGDVRLGAGLAYELWGNYDPSFLVVESPRRGGETSRTVVPRLPLRHTLNPRVFTSVPLGSLEGSLGYFFRPSPLEDGALSGAANLIDTSTHILGLGLAYRFPRDFGPFPMRADLFGQLHFFQRRTVRKDDARAIGAPAYDIGGHGFFYGLSLSGEL